MDPLQHAVSQLARFPGIGHRTASRLIFWLTQQDPQVATDIGAALCELPTKIRRCNRCFTITHSELCHICENTNRATSCICVVERPQDIDKLELTGAFDGTYHVLGGSLSPLEGIGPENLRIRELLERLKVEEVNEIVIAVDPDTEGDATAMYLAHLIKPLDITVTRIAHGITAGTEIEHANANSLRQALTNRTPI